MSELLRTKVPQETQELPGEPRGRAGVVLARVDARAELERTLLKLLPNVRALLFRMLGPRSDLDDATQEVLIALSAALPRFEARGSVESFARSIAVRVAYRYFRRRSPHAALDPERHADGSRLPDEELAQRRALLRLHRCLSKLPARRRAAFVLCAIEGLAPEEAAGLLGTTPGAVRSRLMHARDELKRLLAAEGGAQRG